MTCPGGEGCSWEPYDDSRRHHVDECGHPLSRVLGQDQSDAVPPESAPARAAWTLGGILGLLAAISAVGVFLSVIVLTILLVML